VNAPVVVILAAGQGTRMRSRTPKVLHDLCGRPMIAWPVAAAREAGASRVIVVDAPARVLDGQLDDDVEIAVQPEPNGTGGAVAAAAELLEPGKPVVVLSGDVPLLGADAIRELVGAHSYHRAAATVATTILEDPAGYGRVLRDGGGGFERIVETKAAGDATPEDLAVREVNAGVYVFDGGALLGALPRLRPDNAQGELYLPDVLTLLREDGGTVAVHEVRDRAVVLGVNDRVQLAEARDLARRRIIAAHQRAGVDVLDPASTHIDLGVELGQDTVVEPFTILRGATRAGEGCRLGPSSTLIDVVLGDEAVVRHTYAIEAEIGDQVSVGPFAYLRPGTVLRPGAKIGTFVEVKNSDVGEGAKVPHLSYLGDADVGAAANLGAGTITANYDGTHKHRTTIGAGVKGGVDVALVAPVALGDRAWTAAGSVITEDVPPGALGVARERQVNVEGYDARRRPEADPR
jgi:bifunctional UDP-N-acetylglucosamine pyrophosphorylase/glucosamine-1-phosphate N-acetyltransferase